MSSRLKVSLAIAIVFGAILFIAATSLPKNTAAFYPVAKYVDQQDQLADRFVKVEGNVVPGSIKYETKSMDLRFTLEDQQQKGKRVDVFYNGVKPDTLQDGITVVAAGRMGADGTFAAKDLIVKCPSRYITTDGKPADGKQQPGNNRQTGAGSPPNTGR